MSRGKANGVSGISGGGSLSLVRRSPKKTVKGEYGISYGGSTTCMGVHVSGRVRWKRVRAKQPPLSKVRTSGYRLISITIGLIPPLEWVSAIPHARVDGQWTGGFPLSIIRVRYESGSDVASCTARGYESESRAGLEIGPCMQTDGVTRGGYHQPRPC